MPKEKLPGYAPKELIKVEFGRRLQDEIVRRGWNQSELARQAALHMPDRSFGRDLISGYIRGRIMPSPVHLNAICRALGKTPEELLPHDTAPTTAESPIRTQDLGNNRVLLQINQVVDWPVALQILNTLKGSNA